MQDNKNKRDSVTIKNLNDAFKALNEIEYPQAEKGIKPNRLDLHETLKKVSKTDLLLEDYYDVNSSEEMSEAQEEREAEINKAKLARIEKIVDLNAESPEDLLPSYVGKVIIQCPQCMTLFYKNPEDIEHSEENPEVVNVEEVCQHCGNTDGYTLIGKVDNITEDEAEKYDLSKVEAEGEDVPVEEVKEEPEEESTEETAEESDEDLNLEELPIEEEEKDEVKESLNESTELKEAEETTEVDEVSEPAFTVGDFIKEVGDYDAELSFEWKPIVIDDKEYTITGIAYDDSEEGKITAEVIYKPAEATENAEKDSEVVEETVEVTEDKEEAKAEEEAKDESDPNGSDYEKTELTEAAESLTEAVDPKKALQDFIDSLDESAELKEEALTEDKETEEKIKDFVKSLPESKENCEGETCEENLTEAKNDFEVSEKEFHDLINDPTFKEFDDAIVEDLNPTTVENAIENLEEVRAEIEAEVKAEEEAKNESELEDDSVEEAEYVEAEDFDESYFNKQVTDYLTEVYSNVKNFETTSCNQKEGKLIIEGLITFNSGKTRQTVFEFTEKERSNTNILFEGLNKDFSADKAFTLDCIRESHGIYLAPSKLSYSYKVNDRLVEGLK